MAGAGIRERLTRWLSEVSTHDTSALNWARGVLVLDVMLVPLVFFWSWGHEVYLISALFGAIFSFVIDPGGAHGLRVARMAVFGGLGAGLTALGFWLGGQAWGWLMLAAFAVTVVCSLAIVRGVHAFVAGLMLNIWFIIAIGVGFSLHLQTRVTSYVWGQAVAWAAGSALWIAVASIVWLIRRREDEAPQPVAEIPGDMTPRKLSRSIVAFALIRALALSGAVALAFGANLSHAVWLPIATVIAMRPSLEASTVMAVQRLIGAVIGAVAAGLLLLIPANEHGARLVVIDFGLTIVAIVLFVHGAAIRFFNFALYTAAVAAGVLTIGDLTQPSNYSAEGYRVLWTLIGVAIGVAVTLLAQLLSRRTNA
jgi:hypothetical protein